MKVKLTLRQLNNFLKWARKLRPLFKKREENSMLNRHIKAAQSLVDTKTMLSEEFRRYRVGNQFYSDKYKWVHPEIIEFWEHFDKALKERNIPMRCFEFYRSNERQQKLFEEGRSKAAAGKSPHNLGLALDVVGFHRYWELAREEWEVIGAIGKEVARKRKIDIEWGGDWPWDPAHWELKTFDVLKGIKENGKAEFATRTWRDYRAAEEWRIANNLQLPDETAKRFAMWENIFSTNLSND